MSDNRNDSENPSRNEITRRKILEGGAGVFATAAVASAIVIRPGQPSRHVISLYNFSATSNCYKILIKGATPTTGLASASVPSGWIQTANYPTSVEWALSSGGAIPTGDPIVGTFSIDVQSNASGGQSVLVQWLSSNGTLLCEQPLLVDCGNGTFAPQERRRSSSDERAHANEAHATNAHDRTRATSAELGARRTTAMVPVLAKAMPGHGATPACGCFAAETPADPDSGQYVEHDVEVVLGTPTRSGFLSVDVPYTLMLEPPSLQVALDWKVTVTDEVGDEQPITIPYTDDLVGLATFTLPEAGEYNFYLTVVDPASCAAEKYRDIEELLDDDVATYVTEETTSQGEIKSVDLCDPHKYQFQDMSEPLGDSPTWTVHKTSKTGPIEGTQSGSTATYTFLTLGPYYVCFNANDPPSSGGGARPELCTPVTPAAAGSIASFHCASYNSCVYNDFVVTFVNDSKAANCTVKWDWVFGDGGTSALRDPTHTYHNPGTYKVGLTMTDLTSNQTYTHTDNIVVAHWEPDITKTNCGDGHVIWETSAPCNLGLFHCRRTWDFPGATWHHFRKHKKRVEVCYENPGTYWANLTATNLDCGECTTTQEVLITAPIPRCCPKDKIKRQEQISYSGNNYLLIFSAKYHGKFLPRIMLKTKVKGSVNPAFIEAKVNGTIFGKDSTGCLTASHTVSASKSHSHRRKAKKCHYPGIGRFCARQHALGSTHTLKIDLDDPNSFFVRTIDLWDNDCGCG